MLAVLSPATVLISASDVVLLSAASAGSDGGESGSAVLFSVASTAALLLSVAGVGDVTCSSELL